MNENDPNLGDAEPSWLQDGIEITSEQRDFQDEDNQDWDTNAWTQGAGDDVGEIRGSSCSPGESADTSKIYFRAAQWDGEQWTCIWVESTACP